MSTTERKLFSYDREEDADIHELLNQLPKRQQSKYIRMALRLLKEQLNGGDISQTRTVSHDMKQKKADESASGNKNNEDDDFEDVSSDILNLGK